MNSLDNDDPVLSLPIFKSKGHMTYPECVGGELYTLKAIFLSQVMYKLFLGHVANNLQHVNIFLLSKYSP